MIHGILFDAVYGRSPMSQSSLEAFLAVVSGISQATNWDDIFWNAIPNFFEHLAVVDVRFCELIVQNQKSINFNGRMNLHPVLVGTMIIWGVFPALFPTAETCGISGYDGLPALKAIQNEAVEPLPDVVPALGSVMFAQNGMVWNDLELKVISEAFHQTLGLSKPLVEELP